MDPVTVIIRGKHDTGKTSLARLIEDFMRGSGYRHVTVEDVPSLPPEAKAPFPDRFARNRDLRPYLLKVELETPRPKIVCLCGSTKFYKEFQRANYEETMAGRIVLSVGFFMHSPEAAHGQTFGCTPEQKVALDELHLQKITLADEVLVLNVGGYIGSSTRRELAFAIFSHKLVRFLEPAAGEAYLVEHAHGLGAFAAEFVRR